MDNPRIQWLVDNVRGKLILDIGFIGKKSSNLGLHEAIKKKNRKALIVGIDINQELLFKFRAKNSLLGSVFAIPLKSESFDGVVLGEVIEHFFDITGLVNEVSRVLRPRGKLYLTTPNTYAFFRWLKHWMLLDSKKIINIKNAKGFLGDQDHKMTWDPLSLINLLAINRLKTISLTTKTLAFPYIPFLREKDISWWPFSRLEEHICLIAEKQ